MPIITILSVSKLNGDWGVTLNTRRYPNIKTLPTLSQTKQPVKNHIHEHVMLL